MIIRSLPVGALLLAVLTTGCASELPAYQWVDHDTAMRDIAARADAVKTLTARCRIILQSPDGGSTQLEGVIATSRPDQLRLRAWKLSQPAFDLTITADGLWVFDGDTEHPHDDLPADQGFAWLASALEALGGIVVISPTERASHVDRRGGATHRIQRPINEGGGVLTCDLDRRTLTFRQCMVQDGNGSLLAGIIFDRYRVTDDVVHPGRIEASSGDRTITVLVDDVEINPELPASAFVPPPRATKKR